MPFDPRQQMNPSAPGLTVWQRFAAMQQPQQQPQQQGAPGQPPPQAGPMGMNNSFISAIKEQMEKDNQPEPSPQSVNMDGQTPPTPGQQTSQSLAAGAQDANKVAQMGAQLKMARGGPVHMATGGGLDLGGMTSGSLFGTQPGLTFRQTAALGQEEEEAEGPDSYQAMLEKRMADEGSDAPVTSRDKWMALLQASLGTMAAAGQPGSTALGAIGQGGLTGLQGLREVQAQRAKEKMSKDALLGQLEQHKQTVAERKSQRYDRRAASAALIAQQDRSDNIIHGDRVISERNRHQETMARLNENTRENNLRDADRDQKAAALKLQQAGISAAEQREIRAAEDHFYATNEFRATPFDAAAGRVNPLASLTPEQESAERTKAKADSLFTPPKVRKQLKSEESDARAEFEKTDDDLSRLQASIRKLKSDPETGLATGFLKTPSFFDGTKRKEIENTLKGLASGRLITTLKALKTSPTGASGFGSLSNQEGEILLNALGALDPSMPDEDFVKAHTAVDATISRMRERGDSLWKSKYSSQIEKTEYDGDGNPITANSQGSVLGTKRQSDLDSILFGAQILAQ